MQQYILPFLAKNQQLALQDIGTFYGKQSEPVWTAVPQELQAPNLLIEFTNGANKTSTKFVDYVAQKLNITFTEAEKYIKKEIEETILSTNNTGLYSINGLGQLQKKDEAFLFSNEVKNYYQTIPANKVIRQDATHSIRVGETHTTNVQMQEFYDVPASSRKLTWFTIAVVLTIATLAYIAFYYYQNNGL